MLSALPSSVTVRYPITVRHPVILRYPVTVRHPVILRESGGSSVQPRLIKKFRLCRRSKLDPPVKPEDDGVTNSDGATEDNGVTNSDGVTENDGVTNGGVGKE